MKSLVINKMVGSLIICMICSFTINAASPREYVYDTIEENGQILSKVVFVQDNGLLNKQVKYDFTYNPEGKVKEKKAFRWNGSKDSWDPFFSITYTYTENSETIHSTYGMWDNKKKDYSFNVQQIEIPVINYDEIFS